MIKRRFGRMEARIKGSYNARREIAGIIRKVIRYR